MTQGYVIHAINTDEVDYEQCARVLTKSLRLVGDTRPVTIITGKDLQTDSVNSSNCGVYADDWQIYGLSPYDETFKLEADMIVTRSLDSWWTLCHNRDLFIATGCRNYKQELSQVRYYRQFNDRNNLPDVYNGITYFKKSKTAQLFFEHVRTIFGNWSEINSDLEYQSALKHGDTDSVYALAAAVIGIENCTIRNDIIQWVHMKSHINYLVVDEWDHELIWELIGSDFRINTFSQIYPVHYHVKSLAKELESLYDKQLQTIL
jgi:hypothetical protein